MFHYSNTALVAAILAAVGVVSYAATIPSRKENSALAIGKAKISLIQAITAAEHYVSGKAVQAAYEQTKAGWAYDVAVASGAKLFNVKVDEDKGTVLSSTEDGDAGPDRATR